jgi:hypothetical protein
MRFYSFSFALVATLITAAGCSAGVEDASAAGDEAITGVTDLSALEAELGLVKDVQEHGQWSRPEAKLAAGPCYKKTIAGPNGASFEVRRYKQGAAFFAKRGSGQLTGDKRAVECVDVDVADDGDKGPNTFALSGVALDMAMRFHLGKPVSYDGGLGHIYVDFERGEVEIGEPEHYCGIVGTSGEQSPGPEAFAQAITTCKQHGGGEDDCDAQAMKACEKAVAKDVIADTIDRPAFDSIDAYPSSYLYHLQMEQNDPKTPNVYVSGSLASLAYRYAYKVGSRRDAFTLSGDPLGPFVKMDQVDNDDKTSVEHARFEHVDAHRVVTYNLERLAITPKSSDDHIVENAVVLCTRSLNDDFVPTTAFQCRGL